MRTVRPPARPTAERSGEGQFAAAQRPRHVIWRCCAFVAFGPLAQRPGMRTVRQPARTTAERAELRGEGPLAAAQRPRHVVWNCCAFVAFDPSARWPGMRTVRQPARPTAGRAELRGEGPARRCAASAPRYMALLRVHRVWPLGPAAWDADSAPASKTHREARFPTHAATPPTSEPRPRPTPPGPAEPPPVSPAARPVRQSSPCMSLCW